MADLVGQQVDRYHILEPLGEGGMAIVYKAYDIRLESDVAVKFIRTENLAPNVLERALKRFEREAKALAKLTHSNIVKVLDYGEFEGKPYLVMPYLPGGTLKQQLGGKPMGYEEAARLLIPVARALAYAHQQGMVHRDVKPSNVLITESGDPLLTDFGIAKIIDEEATQDLTGTSAAVGTPEYMAPEQVTSKNVDHRADIYALGIVFYEMVTGRRPFQADTPMAVLFKHASEPLPRPTKFVSGLPDSVERFLLKALAKNPENRYQSMNEFILALQDTLQSKRRENPRPVAPTHTASAEKAVKRERKYGPPMLWTGIATLILAIAALSIFLLRNNEILSVQPSLTAPVAGSTILQQEVSIADSSFISPKDGMTLVHIPEGFFTMGSEEGDLDEKPVRKNVRLRDYWIDQTEVTNAMYAQCVNNGACRPPVKNSSSTRDVYYGDSQYDQYPVIYVSWEQARLYCEWAGRRLPTEAEWEKASRGTDKRIYPWGDLPPDESRGNFGSVHDDTLAVGSFPEGKSSYGVLDLAGNVWEWVGDYYDFAYYADPSSYWDPMGPSTGEDRIVRGGAWNFTMDLVRATNRNPTAPTVQNYVTGFRCAVSSP